VKRGYKILIIGASIILASIAEKLILNYLFYGGRCEFCALIVFNSVTELKQFLFNSLPLLLLFGGMIVLVIGMVIIFLDKRRLEYLTLKGKTNHYNVKFLKSQIKCTNPYAITKRYSSTISYT
jgi:hypothetical protein